MRRSIFCPQWDCRRVPGKPIRAAWIPAVPALRRPEGVRAQESEFGWPQSRPVSIDDRYPAVERFKEEAKSCAFQLSSLDFSSNWICMHRFMAGVTSSNTASIDSTKSTPVLPRTSSSVMG